MAGRGGVRAGPWIGVDGWVDGWSDVDQGREVGLTQLCL